jgi:2-polyprenyl-3-methyl-5-hydroxy-6-metoxy-1,4-benzoquinol methylase
MSTKLKDRAEIKSWIDSQEWYQRIQLSNGLETTGKVDSKQRLTFFKGEQIAGRTVLDIGCNSGYYCLWAKKQGAARVIGIDIDEHRLEQARILAEIEELDIEYYLKPLSEIPDLGKFDIVFCFAVLTEIADLLGSLHTLTNVIGHKAFVEMALTKPLLYLSLSPSWLKSFVAKRYSYGTLEIRKSKRGWMLSPSLRTLRLILGDSFKVSHIGKGPRYDTVCIERV